MAERKPTMAQMLPRKHGWKPVGPGRDAKTGGGTISCFYAPQPCVIGYPDIDSGAHKSPQEFLREVAHGIQIVQDAAAWYKAAVKGEVRKP